MKEYKYIENVDYQAGGGAICNCWGTLAVSGGKDLFTLAVQSFAAVCFVSVNTLPESADGGITFMLWRIMAVPGRTIMAVGVHGAAVARVRNSIVFYTLVYLVPGGQEAGAERLCTNNVPGEVRARPHAAVPPDDKAGSSTVAVQTL